MRIEMTTAGRIISDPNFPALRDEYSAECRTLGLPDPHEKEELYREMDKSYSFAAFGAYEDRQLIGFMGILTPILPHYGVCVAVVESLFVGAAYRKTGAGLRLIREAESYAKKMLAPAIMISAPTGGRLMTLLPRLEYHETNRAFCKELK